MKNEWNNIATEARQIQDGKNRVLNGKLFALVAQYAKKGGAAFDYGCGWGEFADEMAKRGFSVEAFDSADSMIAEAQRRFSLPRFYTHDEFKKKLTSLTKKFDVVTSNLVLCILSRDEQDAMLKNLKLLAKHDAPIIISLCHPCSDYLTVGVVTKRMRSHTWNPRYDREFRYKKSVHENGIEFTDYHRPLAYYAKLFKEHGLHIEDIKESETLGTDAHPDFITFVLKSI